MAMLHKKRVENRTRKFRSIYCSNHSLDILGTSNTSGIAFDIDLGVAPLVLLVRASAPPEAPGVRMGKWTQNTSYQ